MNYNFEKFLSAPVKIESILNYEENRYAYEKSFVKEFEKGQVIIPEGTISKGIYIIKNGKIKVAQSGIYGKENIVTILSEGEFFGMNSVINDEPNYLSFSAMDRVVISFVSKEIFAELYMGSEALRKKITHHLLRQNNQLVNKLTILSHYPVKHKVAISLVMLNLIFSKTGNGEENVISIGRDDLAAFTGIATESVVRALRILKDENIIATKGARIKIINTEALNEMIDQCEHVD
jgi:CRP/FNR family transcriptional regulator, anaerobic regulatory protein